MPLLQKRIIGPILMLALVLLFFGIYSRPDLRRETQSDASDRAGRGLQPLS